MSDKIEDSDALDQQSRGEPLFDADEIVWFGDYSVISPGVQIILEGRPVSHFG